MLLRVSPQNVCFVITIFVKVLKQEAKKIREHRLTLKQSVNWDTKAVIMTLSHRSE